MAAGEDFKSYIQYIWELVEPSTRGTIVMTDEVREKIDDAKTAIVELIQYLENHSDAPVRNVSVPPTLSATVSSQQVKNPAELLEEDVESDLDDDDSENTGSNSGPPAQGATPAVGASATGGTPTPVSSTSTSGTSGSQGSAEIQRNLVYRDDDHPEDYYRARKEELDQLYRILIWLDMLATGNAENYSPL